VRDLIKRLLQKDKERRLGKVCGVYEILSHPWMKKLPIQSILSKSLNPPFETNLFQNNFDKKEITKNDSSFKKEL
jgi:serum/glucocorticoid-regulated kinase 2